MLQDSSNLQLCLQFNQCDLFNKPTTNSDISFNYNTNIRKKQQVISCQQVATGKNNQVQEKHSTRPVNILEKMVSFSHRNRIITMKKHRISEILVTLLMF